MTHPIDTGTRGPLRIGAGEMVELGWLARDLPFLTRTLRFLLRADSDEMRHELGLEPGEIGILAMIGHNPGISQNGLAGSLVLKKSAVTKIVQALEKRGLIERTRSETDRRWNELNLTKDGEAMAEQMRVAAIRRHDDWFDGIPEAERRIFFDVLFGIVEKLAVEGAEGAADDD
ncbi:MarR family transcriptional regulator [Rhodobacterales bacterium HKCCE3408]|nr:MarR family transcriptional regulator [Rhodobacterales bacterium HKCCE3408]